MDDDEEKSRKKEVVVVVEVEVVMVMEEEDEEERATKGRDESNSKQFSICKVLSLRRLCVTKVKDSRDLCIIHFNLYQ